MTNTPGKLERGSYSHELSFPAASPHPVLLRVCHESRQLALAHYKPFISMKPEVFDLPHTFNHSTLPELNGVTVTRKTKDIPNVGSVNYYESEVRDKKDKRYKDKIKDKTGTAWGLKKQFIICFPKRSYVDLKNDTIYIGAKYVKDPDEWDAEILFPSIISIMLDKRLGVCDEAQECAQVHHLAIDYESWRESTLTQESLENQLEAIQAWLLELETLTLVVSSPSKPITSKPSLINATALQSSRVATI
jgi:hypothetical protein